MRILLNGQQAFGKAVLEALVDRGEEVVAVYCAPEAPGGRADPLKEFAEARGVVVHQPPSFREPAVWEEMVSLRPDLGVMAFVTLFVPEQALNIPSHGTIQYHPSLLPLHRGPSAINWPIIFGETKTGLSIFWPDNGLDEGPILLQKEVAISVDDTLGSVYFDQLFPLGVDAMVEAVDMVRAGTAPRIAQDPARATYESWCRKAEVEIDWAKPVAAVYNLIRGANPAPGAWTRHGGRVVQIFDCARETGPAGAPGEVTAVEEGSFSVAATGGAIRVRRVRPEGGAKQAAAEFAALAGLSVGDRLG